MGNNDYDYDYHHLAEDAEYLDDHGEGVDEYWDAVEEDDILSKTSWENYYHNIAEEIDED